MDICFKDHLEEVLGEELKDFHFGANKIQTVSGQEYFLKSGAHSETYRCEANGLTEIRKSGAIKTSEVKAFGANYILTEYIHQHSPKGDFFIRFGKSFADLHRFKGSTFGFYEDNFIGRNVQLNLADGMERSSWSDFYFNMRLLPQYKMAKKNQYITSEMKSCFMKLESKIGTLLKDSTEAPCLLHGDLWGGNFIANKENEVVLIDPAVYYGHREADLAMTKLFGGFPDSFYAAYQEEYPLPPGWEYREGLYKLYHVMNHLNIFGQGYLSETMYLLSFYAK